MYLRTIKRKNKDGSVVEYVQLAHNVRHPEKGYPRAEVIHSFGRREQLDIDGLKRLVASIGRFIEFDAPNAEPVTQSRVPALKFVRSQSVGVIYLLQALWDRLQISDGLQKIIDHRTFSASIERALFTLVASGGLAPPSVGVPLAPVGLTDRFPGPDASLEDRDFLQAANVLSDHADAIQKEVSRSATGMLNLSLDQVFVGVLPLDGNVGGSGQTTMAGNGRSRHRGDPIDGGTMCMAVSPEGIPLHSWSFPTPRVDETVVESVNKDLSAWQPGRIIWVMDRHATTGENLDILRRAGNPTIVGERLQEVHTDWGALTHKGRFKILGPDLQIKETSLGGDAGCGRCVIAYHPEQAALDRKARDNILRRLRYKMENRDAGGTTDRHPMERYVKVLRNGISKIDVNRIRREEKNDGKYLLVSSDDALPAEAVARAHKQLLELREAAVPPAPSPILSTLDLSSDDGVRSGMVLSWLRLLLRRIAEAQTAMSWPIIVREMQRLHLGEFHDGNRRILMYTEPTSLQKKIFKRLNIDPPQPGSENRSLK